MIDILLGRIPRRCISRTTYIFEVNLHNLNCLFIYEDLYYPPRSNYCISKLWGRNFHRIHNSVSPLSSSITSTHYLRRYATMVSQRLPQLPAVLKQRLLVELYVYIPSDLPEKSLTIYQRGAQASMSTRRICEPHSWRCYALVRRDIRT